MISQSLDILCGAIMKMVMLGQFSNLHVVALNGSKTTKPLKSSSSQLIYTTDFSFKPFIFKIVYI